MVSLQQELQVSIIQTLLVKMQLIKVYSKKTAHLVALDSLSHLTSTVKLSEYFKATLISPILKIAHVELMFRQLVVIPLIASLISTYAHSSQAVSTLLVANNGWTRTLINLIDMTPRLVVTTSFLKVATSAKMTIILIIQSQQSSTLLVRILSCWIAIICPHLCLVQSPLFGNSWKILSSWATTPWLTPVNSHHNGQRLVQIHIPSQLLIKTFLITVIFLIHGPKPMESMITTCLLKKRHSIKLETNITSSFAAKGDSMLNVRTNGWDLPRPNVVLQLMRSIQLALTPLPPQCWCLHSRTKSTTVIKQKEYCKVVCAPGGKFKSMNHLPCVMNSTLIRMLAIQQSRSSLNGLERHKIRPYNSTTRSTLFKKWMNSTLTPT